ncbi:hypothetical protein ACOME3_005778 [Neoechinorhynchus agilis]
MNRAGSSIDTGHTDIVHDAKADFYGKLLATCSSDNTIRIFQKSGTSITFQKELKGHRGPVWQLDWSHPMFDSLLVSCSYDRTVRVWRTEAPDIWVTVYEYDHQDASVDCVCFGPALFGAQFACGCADGVISILRFVSRILVRHESPGGFNAGTAQWKLSRIPKAHDLGVNAISWCQSHYLPQTDPIDRKFVSAGSDGLVKVWKAPVSVDEWVMESVLSGGHDDWVRDVKWIYPTPAVKATRIASVGQDKRLIVWQQVREKGEMAFSKKQVITFEDVLWSIDSLPHENVVAVSGRDNKVHLLREIEGLFVRTLDTSMEMDLEQGEMGFGPADEERENHGNSTPSAQ